MLTRYTDWGFGDFDRTLAEFEALRREMNRVFDTRSPRTYRAVQSVYPRIGLFDRGAELVLRAELPGVADEDLEVTVDQGVLTLRGERNVSVPEGYAVHRQERGNLEFARSITLPCRVDTEKTTANLRHGVLTLTMAKAPEDQPRQIAISTK